MPRVLLFLLRPPRPRRPRARRRHLRRRPLGRPRRRRSPSRMARWSASAMAAASRWRRTGSSPTPMSSPARRVPGATVGVGVVPPEGSQAFRARVVAVDAARDLALVEVEGGRFTPIPLFTGALEDGQAVAALGYPGNVDLATARSADDYITPLPPTRSVGIFSNARPINGIATLLHTANIARGHSGGPLLDQCGRVLGVNTLITHNEEWRRALRLRGRRTASSSPSSPPPASPFARSPANASRWPTGCARTRSAPPPKRGRARPKRRGASARPGAARERRTAGAAGKPREQDRAGGLAARARADRLFRRGGAAGDEPAARSASPRPAPAAPC